MSADANLGVLDNALATDWIISVTLARASLALFPKILAAVSLARSSAVRSFSALSRVSSCSAVSSSPPSSPASAEDVLAASASASAFATANRAARAAAAVSAGATAPCTMVAAPLASTAARAASFGGDRSTIAHVAPAPQPLPGWKNLSTRAGRSAAGSSVVAMTTRLPGPPPGPASPEAGPLAPTVCSNKSQRCDGATPTPTPTPPDPAQSDPAKSDPAQSSGSSADASAQDSSRERCSSEGVRAACRRGSLSPRTQP